MDVRDSGCPSTQRRRRQVPGPTEDDFRGRRGTTVWSGAYVYLHAFALQFPTRLKILECHLLARSGLPAAFEHRVLGVRPG